MSNFAKIEEVFFAALELPRESRDVFLRQACGEDDELRREVESLLELEPKAGEFIETPPGDVAAGFFAPTATNSLIGRELGRYVIVAPLGFGGMGEVYEAEDKKLGRRLAIKLLPSHFSQDAERKRRFEREARAASALNHPNIITIHGLESADGVDFIVSELIEGRTLRKLITDGPVSAPDAVAIAVQVADALDAAHSVGVIHRDIKPANIMIRPDGRVKVLDFGLAKLDPAIESGDFEPTRDLTGDGRVMGTVNYMSPEQALGQPLDGRTDLFSLGVCLYEMLAGKPPFAGTTDAAVFDAILNKQAPSLSDINREIPPRLISCIKRALEKKPDDRFDGAAAMREALKSSDAPLGMLATVTGKLGRLIWPAVTVGAMLVVSALIFGILTVWRQFRTAAFDPSSVVYNQLTSREGAETSPSLAPDGSFLVYASKEKGKWGIFRRQTDSDQTVDLTIGSPDDNLQPTISPDGSTIAFRSERDGGGIFLMNPDGSNVRRITSDGYFPAWSPDGAELVISTLKFTEPLDRAGRSDLFAVNVFNGNRRSIPASPDSIQASWSPNGYRIAFWSAGEDGVRDVKTVSADGRGDVINVTDDAPADWNPVWSPDGSYLYFVSNRGGTMGLWRVAINEQTGVVRGEPESVSTPTTYFQHLTFSRDGQTFAFANVNLTSNIESLDFDARSESVSAQPRALTRGAKFFRNPSYSPDGSMIAFDAVTNKQEDIYVMSSDGTNVRQLTNDEFKDRAPTWSPDGKSLAFYSSRSGIYKGWKINLDGTGLTQLTFGEDREFMLVWSPDGKYLVSNPDFKYPVLYLASQLSDQGATETLPDLFGDGSWLMAESWSPDSTKIATMRISQDPKVAGIVTYDVNTRKYEILTEFGVDGFWLGDSRRLIFVDVDKLYLVDSQTKRTKHLTTVDGKIQLITISPDDRIVTASIQRIESDIWIGKLN